MNIIERIDRLTEATDFESFWENVILKECQDILFALKQINDDYPNEPHLLWRGSKSEITYKKIVPHQKRKPVDINPFAHEFFDRKLEKKFGWKARSSGTFVISDKDDAGDYGPPKIFFPANGYKFIWNKRVSDLFEWFIKNFYEDEYDYVKFLYAKDSVNKEGAEEELRRSMKLLNKPLLTWKNYLRYLKDRLNKRIDQKLMNFYVDDDLSNAIRAGHEIMFKCKYYYLIDADMEERVIERIRSL